MHNYISGYTIKLGDQVLHEYIHAETLLEYQEAKNIYMKLVEVPHDRQFWEYLGIYF